MLQIGSLAPSFEGVSTDGTILSLGHFREKRLILYFYPKDNTPGCTTEACDFQDNLSSFKSRNVSILGVSPDTIGSHEKFSGKYGLAFPLISDPENIISKLYGVWKEKINYGRTYMGIERTTFIIDEVGIIIAILPKVRVKGHIQALVDLL